MEPDFHQEDDGGCATATVQPSALNVILTDRSKIHAPCRIDGL
jgi:hypothetical protein